MVLSVGSWLKQNWFCTCSSEATMTLPSARDITSVYITRANSYCGVYTRSITGATINTTKNANYAAKAIRCSRNTVRPNTHIHLKKQQCRFFQFKSHYLFATPIWPVHYVIIYGWYLAMKLMLWNEL